MITTKKLLQAVKEAHGIPSNYKLAPFLGVTEHTVGSWNVGRNLPDEKMSVRLAELAGLDPSYVLASIAAERAKDEGVKAAWASLAKRLEGIAAALVLAILANLGAVSFDRGALASTGIEAPSVAKMAISHVIHRSK